MKSPASVFAYIMGYLEATLGSPNDYTAHELREKMAHLVEYLRDHDVEETVN